MPSSFPSSSTKDGNQETLLQAINSLVDYAYIECDRNSRVLVETDFEIIRSTLAEIEDKLKHAKSSKNNNDFTPSPNNPSTSIQQESNDKTRTENFQDVDKDEKEMQQPKSESVNDKIVLTKKRRKLSFPLLSPMVSVEEDEITKELPSTRRGSFDPFSFARRKSSSVHPGPTRMSMHNKSHIPLKKSPDDDVLRMARDAFNIIDENGDGFLQKEEVVKAIKMMESNGMHFTAVGNDPGEVAENMMREVDIDGNGLIDLDEFVDMMKNNVASNKSKSFLSYNHRMSQLARNVLLAHQKKMENSVLGNDLWMIHPLSNFHVSWDIVMSLLIVLTVFTMPLSIGWDEINRNLFVMNLIVDFLFLSDIVKNFCTGIIDENDSIIMDRKIVRQKYLMGFFLTDFCSSIPLDLIFRLAGADDFVSSGTAVSGTKNSLRMLRLLRMTKLLRLFRVSRLANHVKNFFIWFEETLNIHISDGFTKLVRLAVGAVVLGHWIGCLNFMLVRLYDFPPDSWVVYAGLEDESPLTQWSWSFFKALAQMIMIGFETPPFTNASCDTMSQWCGIEHWITLCCLYIGAVFYSLLISSISSILQTANLASRQFEEKLMQIDDYMRSKKLPASMREKVKDCFHLQHSNGKMYDENEILDMLSPVLRREVKLFTGRDLTMKVPLLSSVPNKYFAEEMVAALEPMISFQNEIILRENTTGGEMYFISSGVVEIFLAGSNSSSYVAIGDGCYFGEVSLLLNIRRTASARTKTQCMLFKITKNLLMSILKDFPDTLKHMIQVAESRQKRLKHYTNPTTYPLAKEDEVDLEDSKTILFGADSEKVVSQKEEESLSRRKPTGDNRRGAALLRARRGMKVGRE